MPERSYTYYDFTLSLCPHCLRRVDAKIVFEDGRVFMFKHCPEHGSAVRVRIHVDPGLAAGPAPDARSAPPRNR